MPISSISIGTTADTSSPDALKAALAEFISMLIFVFAGEGAGMAFGKIIVSLSIHEICKVHYQILVIVKLCNDLFYVQVS